MGGVDLHVPRLGPLASCLNGEPAGATAVQDVAEIESEVMNVARDDKMTQPLYLVQDLDHGPLGVSRIRVAEVAAIST